LGEQVGTFEETFQWVLKGSNTTVPLTIRGKVSGPTFDLSTDHITFGQMSYSFK